MNKKTILILVLLMMGIFTPLLSVKATPTYYGNFNNSVLLESNGLVRKWIVRNETVILLQSYGASYDPGIYNISVTNIFNGLKVNVSSGLFDHWFSSILKNYNLSSYDLLEYNFIGDGTGGRLYMDLFAPDYSNRFMLPGIYCNNIIGNYKLLIPFNSTMGVPDKSIITELDIVYFPMSINTIFYIDSLKAVTYYYYQIWDGSTLKYQGLINPDINDFIIQAPIISQSLYSNNITPFFIVLLVCIVLSVIAFKIPIAGFIAFFISIGILIIDVSSGTVTDTGLRIFTLITIVVSLLSGIVGYVLHGGNS